MRKAGVEINDFRDAPLFWSAKIPKSTALTGSSSFPVDTKKFCDLEWVPDELSR